MFQATYSIPPAFEIGTLQEKVFTLGAAEFKEGQNGGEKCDTGMWTETIADAARQEGVG